MHDGRSAALAAPIGIGIGLAVPLFPGLVAGIAVGSVQIGFVVFVAALATRGAILCTRSLRADGRLTHVGTLVASVGTMMAVALPGAQLLAGSRVSKLADLGRPTADPSQDVLRAYALFGLALLALAVGEELANSNLGASFRAQKMAHRARLNQQVLRSQGVYFSLLAIGAIAYLLHPSQVSQETLALRGTVKGQGISQLMGYGPAIAAAVGILRRHWGSRALSLVSVAAVVLGVAIGGTRSPLLIVGAAASLRLLTHLAHSRSKVRTTATLAVLVYVGAILLVGVSDWRGRVLRGEQITLPHALVNAASDPFARLTKGGLDTLDGSVLALQVDRTAVHASAFDPAKAVVNFVPSQLWPGKPTWLSAEVTHYYLSFGNSSTGIFLSGPGYAYIAFGGAFGMLLSFLLLGYGLEVLFQRSLSDSIWASLLIYFVLRFTFAGDAFDAFHVLGLCLLVLLAYGVTQAVGVLVGSSSRKTVRSTGVSGASAS